MVLLTYLSDICALPILQHIWIVIYKYNTYFYEFKINVYHTWTHSRHSTLLQRCFKVDFRSRSWTTNFLRWNNVIDFNVGKNNIFSTLFQRQISTMKQHQISTLKLMHISTIINLNTIEFFSTLKFDVVSTLFKLVFTCSEITEIHKRSPRYDTNNNCNYILFISLRQSSLVADLEGVLGVWPPFQTKVYNAYHFKRNEKFNINIIRLKMCLSLWKKCKISQNFLIASLTQVIIFVFNWHY